MFLVVGTLAAPGGCSIAGQPQPKDTHCASNVDIQDQSCWTVPGPPNMGGSVLPPGGGHPPVPGSITVQVVIDSFNAQGQRLNVPVHVVAQAHTANGSPAIDAETGLPWLHRDAITTPDILTYYMGPGVTGMVVDMITIGDPGQILKADLVIEGKITQKQQKQISGRDPQGPGKAMIILFDIDL